MRIHKDYREISVAIVFKIIRSQMRRQQFGLFAGALLHADSIATIRHLELIQGKVRNPDAMPRLLVIGAFAGRAAHDKLTGFDENLPVTFGGCRATRRIVDLGIAIIVTEVADLRLPRVHQDILIIAIRAQRAATTITIPVLVLATHSHGWPG